MNRLFILLMLFTSFNIIYSQQEDLESRVKNLEARLDSLQKIIINNSMSYTAVSPVVDKRNDTTSVAEDDLLEALTSFISFDEKVQSSKKRRINDILEALRSRDGVLNFNGDATSIIQHRLSEDRFSLATGSFDFFAFSQLGKYIKIFIDLEGKGGAGPNSRISTFSGLNGDAGSLQDDSGIDRIHVLEAWTEFSFFNDWLQVTAGKIDITNYFDVNNIANDETSQFISDGFINSAAFPAPLNSPGIRLNVDLSNLLLFQLAVSSNDNSGDNIFSSLFKIASTGINVDFGNNIIGFVHIFGYENDAYKDASGFGLSGDIRLMDKIALFYRWNQNNNNMAAVHGVKTAWSCGSEYLSDIGGQIYKIGVAFGNTESDSNLLTDERQSEIYASYQVNQWIYLSPHIQTVWNAAGIKGDNLTLAGFRTQFHF